MNAKYILVDRFDADIIVELVDALDGRCDPYLSKMIKQVFRKADKISTKSSIIPKIEDIETILEAMEDSI